MGPSPSPVWLEGPNSQGWYGQDPLWIWASTDLVRCVPVQKAQTQPGDPRPSPGWGSLVWTAQEWPRTLGGRFPCWSKYPGPRSELPFTSLPTIWYWEVDFREADSGCCAEGMDIPPS